VVPTGILEKDNLCMGGPVHYRANRMQVIAYRSAQFWTATNQVFATADLWYLSRLSAAARKLVG
jgi:hypothetical protein